MAEKVEYDVAVNLKMNAGKSGIAGRAMSNEVAAAERERRKAMERAAREYARRMEREKKLRERELEAAKKAKALWWGGARKGTAENLSGMTGGIAGAFKSVGTGPALEWAKSAALAAGVAFAAGFGYVAGKGLIGGVQENAASEATQNRIGTTLQLFDFNAAAGAANQYTNNLQDAAWYQKELVRIADASPGDVEQVEKLFQNMLPGMASITQDARQITDLTQKATLLSAVLGNRFDLVGEQASRMLTGGAGAEMDTWRLLQKPILEAGKAMGAFSQGQGLGESLTQAFNKLDPQKRLAVFEAGLEALGPQVADQYGKSWEGITAQATSAGKTLRKTLGTDMFTEIKAGLAAITQNGGPLDSSGPKFRALKEFMGFLGEGAGAVVKRGMEVAGSATSYIVDNWQQIVMRAQEAAHYLVSGAKLAAGLTAARFGAGLGLGAAGFALDSMRGIGSAITGVVSMGSAALVAAPALLAAGAAAAGLGIVALGAGLMLGGVVTYLVSNLDSFMEKLRSGAVDIQPFLKAIDDLGAKMYALGGHLLGAGGDTDVFQVAVDAATNVVKGVTNAFEWLLRTTADVITAFADVADWFKQHNPLNAGKYAELAFLESQKGDLLRDGDDSFNPSAQLETVQARIDALKEEVGLGGGAGAAREAAIKIREAADVFANAAADPFAASMPSLSEALYNRLYPMGPELPPPGGSMNNRRPPKVEAKVTMYNTMNLREMDPNAVVAAFNRITAQKVSVPLQAALRRAGG